MWPITTRPQVTRAPLRGRARVGRSALAIAWAMLAAAPGPAAAQDVPAPQEGRALRVYLDCSGRRFGVCDLNLWRQQITFVNWVREPQDAQVMVILTSQESGGGGTRYTLDYLGQEDLQGLEDQYRYDALVTDVQDETVQGLVRTLRLGLVRYLAAAGLDEGIDVTLVGPGAQAAGAERPQVSPEDDPWDFWVFNVDLDASLESEDLQDSRELGFGLSANRTTAAWRFNLGARGDFEREEFELPQDDGSVTTVTNDQDSWNLSALAVKTLGAHWGSGVELVADNSTQLNRDLLVGLGTGIEYNYFPYAESNRRVLLARYVVNASRVSYQDTTVFDLLEETVYQHELSLDYEAREPWGNANIGMGLSQYLDRTDAWSFNVRGFVRYRVFRGFSVNLNGEYRRVRDQIYLSKEELSEEDILLGRRRLPTEAELEFRIGLSYSFGSIFNNAVNERLRFGVL
ncbi:MAG TPA: hypothetical protein VK849_13750 [Longimicrobiales bacterium]|nr:hypothetical protein [Longimicrobiales bacterium]